MRRLCNPDDAGLTRFTITNQVRMSLLNFVAAQGPVNKKRLLEEAQRLTHLSRAIVPGGHSCDWVPAASWIAGFIRQSRLVQSLRKGGGYVTPSVRAEEEAAICGRIPQVISGSPVVCASSCAQRGARPGLQGNVTPAVSAAVARTPQVSDATTGFLPADAQVSCAPSTSSYAASEDEHDADSPDQTARLQAIAKALGLPVESCEGTPATKKPRRSCRDETDIKLRQASTSRGLGLDFFASEFILALRDKTTSLLAWPGALFAWTRRGSSVRGFTAPALDALDAPPTFVGGCSGTGYLELCLVSAFHSIGVRLQVVACDTTPEACTTFAENLNRLFRHLGCNGTRVANPKPVIDDINEVDVCYQLPMGDIAASAKAAKILGSWRGGRYIVAGGTPCTLYSRARTTGADSSRDEPLRNGALAEFCSLIVAYSPDFVFHENVLGFLQYRRIMVLHAVFFSMWEQVVGEVRRTFGSASKASGDPEETVRAPGRIVVVFLLFLFRSGYSVILMVASGALYGSAQHRRRTIIVGAREGHPPVPLPTHYPGASTSGNDLEGLDGILQPVGAPQALPQAPPTIVALLDLVALRLKGYTGDFYELPGAVRYALLVHALADWEAPHGGSWARASWATAKTRLVARGFTAAWAACDGGNAHELPEGVADSCGVDALGEATTLVAWRAIEKANLQFRSCINDMGATVRLIDRADRAEVGGESGARKDLNPFDCIGVLMPRDRLSHFLWPRPLNVAEYRRLVGMPDNLKLWGTPAVRVKTLGNTIDGFLCRSFAAAMAQRWTEA